MADRTKSLNKFSEDNPFAMSIGDLMAALLLIFVLLLSAAMLNIQKGIEEYRDLKKELHEELLVTFKDSLRSWNAEIIDSTLTVRFFEQDTTTTPKVLFTQGKADLKTRFREILDSFFPRYLTVLNQPKYKDHIDEIRIEGHTSSEWSHDVVDSTEAYFRNMDLSQERTRNVLRYCLEKIAQDSLKKWTQGLLTANGLSSSKVIKPGGLENKTASRRVEFSVRTDAEKQISRMLAKVKGK